MFTATFFFLVLAVCIFAGLICYSLARSAKAMKNVMPADEKAAWEQLKSAIYELHARYESTETPKQKVLRSWAGTCVICAGLCMIGILLEAEYDRLITPDSIFASWIHPETFPCQPVTTPKTKTSDKQSQPAAASKGASTTVAPTPSKDVPKGK